MLRCRGRPGPINFGDSCETLAHHVDRGFARSRGIRPLAHRLVPQGPERAIGKQFLTGEDARSFRKAKSVVFMVIASTAIATGTTSAVAGDILLPHRAQHGMDR